MRKYKAVIIDLKKITTRATALLLAGATAALALYITNEQGRFLPDNSREIIGQNIPVVGAADGIIRKDISRALDFLANFFIGFNPTSCRSVISGTIPAYAAVKDSGLIAMSEYGKGIVSENMIAERETENAQNIPEENRAIIKSIDASQRASEYGIAIGNETSYGVDIRGMLNSVPDIEIGADDVKILITHTHATECYSSTGEEFYDVTASDRTNDTEKNVVAVGRRMAEVFEAKGIKTIHDTVLHDVPSFNGSYAHSLSTVQEYINKYPSIQIVFDIHRDSIVYDDKTKAKTVTEINGEKAAQLMFVVGTDENGLYHPNWRENMKAAIHFQRAICDKYPKLMRHINLRRERFNGHTSGASMIIEVGTSGNTLDEAMLSIEYAAECIADYLKSL